MDPMDPMGLGCRFNFGKINPDGQKAGSNRASGFAVLKI